VPIAQWSPSTLMNSSDGPAAAPNPSSISRPSSGGRRGFVHWTRPRDTKVRTRLFAVVLVPTLAAVLLGGLRVSSALDEVSGYSAAERRAHLADTTRQAINEIQDERSLSARFVASNRLTGSDDLAAQRPIVDAAALAVRKAAEDTNSVQGTPFSIAVEAALNRLGTLSSLRRSVDSTRNPVESVIGSFSAVIADLLAVEGQVPSGTGSPKLASAVRVMMSVAEIKELIDVERAQLTAAIESSLNGLSRAQFDQLIASSALESAALEKLKLEATPAQRQLYEDTVNGAEVDRAQQYKAIVLSRPNVALPANVTTAAWNKAATGLLDKVRTVEKSLTESVVRTTADLGWAAQRKAAGQIAIIAAIVLLAAMTSILITRSLVRPLEVLRRSALDVAGHRLPRLIERLRAPEMDDIEVDGARHIPETAVKSANEIGQVATAFDAVHSEAVRLASEQALLRGSVNAMFVNLSRRSQSLVDRQLRLIDTLEQREQDPDQLENLFRLDHLATRMRRNDENLLVLAGGEPGRRWRQPVSLAEMLKAAAAEVEQYVRIDQSVYDQLSVVGRAVGDIIHLVAELLENATSFSSPDTKVKVTARVASGGGGAVIEIEDHGIGMSEDELTRINERLTEPPLIDAAVSRMMGLFVVGRLAQRNEIRVQLRPSPGSGITALVLIPSDLVIRTIVLPDTDSRQITAPVRHERANGSSSNGHVPHGENLDVPSAGAARPRFRGVLSDLSSAPDSPGASLSPARQLSLRPFTTSPDDRSRAVERPGSQVSPSGTGKNSSGNAERLPIFDSVESEWFRQHSHAVESAGSTSVNDVGNADKPQARQNQDRQNTERNGSPVSGESPVVSAVDSSSSGYPAENSWHSPSDAGWQVVKKVLDSDDSKDITQAGLPVRMPMAKLVPGSAATPGEAPEVPPESPPPTSRAFTPEAVRGLLTNYRRGLQRAREIAVNDRD
jgi:signal transduction histidine kinase